MFRLPQNTALRAGLLMVCAMASFVCNDTIVKIVGESLPVGELIALRGVMAMLLLGFICFWQGLLPELPKIRQRSILLRSSCDLFATIAFVTALVHMPIANLTSVMQAVPLAVALLSMMFLGEDVGWRRMIAIVGGFIGVLLIVKPSVASFNFYELLALLIVFFVALRDILTKRIPARIPVFVVAFANACFVTFGGAALALVQGVQWPELWQVGLLALAACFLSAGYLLMVATLRVGELTGTAPFRYSVMIFAIVSGILVFGEFPDGIAIAGMVLIVICGLYAAHREALRARDLKDSAGRPAP
ncbi:DMT family transporter [Aestuariivirga sp.]|uniref:DMT family transporter n=1 Tax=Aestuariivirga sp. TaxID=2650926 RepID=UPI003BAD6D51